MKNRIALLLAALAGLAATARPGDPAPRLLGVATPAANAIPAPETTILEALSNDGRWLLFTSTSDRLAPNDLNAAADVFLLDRTTGKAALISKGLDGLAGNGTSLGGGMTPDASRVAFLSRASNLASPDTNFTWDVFVREVAAGTHLLASPASKGGSSIGPASDPVISADGRYVVFRSPAFDLAPNRFFSTYNLYRRDLVEGSTECLTTNLSIELPGNWRLTAWTTTPNAQNLVFVANQITTTIASNAVAWRNLATGQSSNCSAALPPEVNSGQLVGFSTPTISADGRFVAFRSESRLDPRASRQALWLHDVEQGTAALLSLRTNDATRQTFPASAHAASFSTDGQYVAYSAPLPTYDPLASVFSNGLSQVYFYDAQAQTTRLVSAAPDGVTPANAEASDVRLTADGRSVFFVSRARNLLGVAATESNRLYWWNRDTGSLQVIGELGAEDPEGRFVVSTGGEWVATLATDAAGALTVYYVQTAESAVGYLHLPLTAEQSASGRGWIAIQPAGVSADGRYVAMTAFPPGPAGDTNHMQIYLHDTLTGTRQLITQGVDGNLANTHGVPPSMSADGTRLLFTSWATNLVTGDLNGYMDVFAHAAPSGERVMLRKAPLPVSAYALPDCLISPDGSVAFATFNENSKPVSRLISLADGTFSAAFTPIVPGSPPPGQVVGLPSFSRDGQRVAVSLGAASAVVATPRIEIHDPAAWLASGGKAVPALWTSPTWHTTVNQAMEPVMSADGSRVAYFHYITSNPSNSVVVMEWTKSSQPSFRHSVGRQSLASLGLSANGTYVSWVSRNSDSNAVNQVWRADVDSGKVELVSVATDGVSEANGNCKSAVISADGRFVAFASTADNFVAAEDMNSAKDVFLRDMLTGQTVLVSRTSAGTAGSGWSFQPFFSADGRSLFFLSHAPDLAAGDYNQGVDLFKVEILAGSGLMTVIQHDLSTGQARLLWNGAADKSYQIQFKDDLGAKGWSTVPGTFTGEGGVDIITAAGTHRFFRVVELK